MAVLMAERVDRPPLALFGEVPGDAAGRAGADASAPRADAHEPPGRAEAGGGPTLDDLVVGAWEGLAARVAVACLLCDEGLLRPAAGPEGVREARCDRCGATLA